MHSNRNTHRFLHPLLCGLLLLLSAPALRGGTVTFEAGGPDSEGMGFISARATLSAMDSLLTITLENTSGPTLRPGDALTALFFTISGSPLLTLNSALAPTVVQSGTPAAGGVNLSSPPAAGGWQFIGYPGPGGFGYSYGLGTAGFGVFHGRTVGNVDYAVVAPGTDVGAPNLKNRPYVQTSAVFTLSGFGGFDVSQVSAAAFAFGTGPAVFLTSEPPTEPDPPPVPEPASWMLAGIGAALVGAGRWLKNRH